PLAAMPVLDTCTEVTAELLKLPGGRGGRYKLPNLTELHNYLFGVPFAEAHNATADVEATTRCFFELVRQEIFTPKELQVDTGYFVDFRQHNPDTIASVGLKHINLKAASDAIRAAQKTDEPTTVIDEELKMAVDDAEFAHLHNHAQFSVLQTTNSIPALVEAAAKANMPAVALTDHGNMMGAFHFVNRVLGYNKEIEAKNAEALEQGEPPVGRTIKPIV